MPRFPTVLAGLLILIPMTSGQDSESGPPTLITNSPFLPPGFQPPSRPGNVAEPPPSAEVTKYEFRGVYQLEDVYYFNIYNPAEKKGQWLTEESMQEVSMELLEFNPDNDKIVLRVSGETTSLSLIETSDKSMPVHGARTVATAPQGAAAKKANETKVRRRVVRPPRSNQVRRSGANKNIRRPVTPAKSPSGGTP